MNTYNVLMNNTSNNTFPQASDRIQSLFSDAKRYREARKQRERNERPTNCEQQMQLSLKVAAG